HVADAVLTGNTASGAGAVVDLGYHNGGDDTFLQTTFSNNHADGGAGAISVVGNLVIAESTLTGNTATGAAATYSQRAYFYDSTLTANDGGDSEPRPGAIDTGYILGLYNPIVANNTGTSTQVSADVSSDNAYAAASLVEDPRLCCSSIDGPANIFNQDPQ